MAFGAPNGPSNNGPDNSGLSEPAPFGKPAPHDPFTRRMTDAEAFESANYLAGNRSGHNFGKLDPKVEAVERGKSLDYTFGPMRYRKSDFGQQNEVSESKPIQDRRHEILDRKWRTIQSDQQIRNDNNNNVDNRPAFPSPPFGDFGQPGGVNIPSPPNPLNQQGRMADSFVAEHNAAQQNGPGFGGQSFGQSFGQPRNDGPQMGF